MGQLDARDATHGQSDGFAERARAAIGRVVATEPFALGAPLPPPCALPVAVAPLMRGCRLLITLVAAWASTSFGIVTPGKTNSVAVGMHVARIKTCLGGAVVGHLCQARNNRPSD